MGEHEGATAIGQFVEFADTECAGQGPDEGVAVDLGVPARGRADGAFEQLLGIVGIKAVGVRALDQLAGDRAQHNDQLLVVGSGQLADRFGEGVGVAAWAAVTAASIARAITRAGPVQDW